MTRNHSGIQQSGKNAGKLKKGYYYTGKKTKRGLPCIAKAKTNRKQTGGLDEKPRVDKKKGRLSKTVAANWNARCMATFWKCKRGASENQDQKKCYEKLGDCLSQKLKRLHPEPNRD